MNSSNYYCEKLGIASNKGSRLGKLLLIGAAGVGLYTFLKKGSTPQEAQQAPNIGSPIPSRPAMEGWGGSSL